VTVYVPVEALAGNRTVQLFNSNNVLLYEQVFDLTVGTHVLILNWWVDAGNGYGIACAENNLFRNNSGLSYPYAIGSVGSIYNTTNGTGYYYYFYNWQIQHEEVACTSERVEVTATVVGINELESSMDIQLYPNPASELIHLSLNVQASDGLVLELFNTLGQAVWARTIPAATGSVQYDITTSELARGVYSLRILSGTEWTMREVILQ